METEYTVMLKKIIDEFTLEKIYIPKDPEEVLVSAKDVNRPGLQLSGFFNYFDPSRIQVMGNVEESYLATFTPQQREESLNKLLGYKPPAVIITRGLEIYPELMAAARKYEVPILRTGDTTSGFMAALIALLNVELAPRLTRHGVLVEVCGEGILLLGDSGVGKSETAIELVRRGHRLIADDAVEIRRVSNRALVGSSPENIRYFVELRGIGVINVRRLFGVGAVNITEKIDMVIQLEAWNPEKAYDRMGLNNEYVSILGIKIPALTIPIKPGRNLAVIIETAAINNRDKKFGYHPAKELLSRLGMSEADISNTTTE